MLNILLCIHIVLHILQKFLNETNDQTYFKKLMASYLGTEGVFIDNKALPFFLLSCLYIYLN